MKINSIQSNNNSFKRAIKIDFVQNPNLYRNNYVIQYGTEELANALNNKPTKVYTEEEKTQLKTFFSNILEDYNEETPVSFHYIPNLGHILLSGEDSKEIRKDYRALRNGIYRKDPEKKLQRKIEISEKIRNKIENGHDNTPIAKLTMSASSNLASDRNKFIKIDNFHFYEHQYFYTSLFDGTIHDEDGDSLTTSHTYNAQNITAKCDFLTLA